jgi:phosphonate transport system permease protein
VADRLAGGYPVFFHLSVVLDFPAFRNEFRYRGRGGCRSRASGVGFDLCMASGYYFDLREVGLITYIILAFAIVLETIATRMKSKIKNHQA